MATPLADSVVLEMVTSTSSVPKGASFDQMRVMLRLTFAPWRQLRYQTWLSWRRRAIQGATSSKLTSEDRRRMRQLTCGLDHRSELEQRMAPSLGKVLLERVIHADADPQQ